MIRITLVFLPVLLLLSGCSSLGQGIAEAVLTSTSKEGEDKRVCQVSGKRFNGLAPSLGDRDGKTKVLMVHGVGSHLPGYSTRLLENLASELNLTVRERHHKNISLRDLTDKSSRKEKLGNLRIHRLLNHDQSEEMLFYELTWSEITADEKALLDYDNSDEYSYRRAAVNDLLKKFSNETGPDPMIYLGESRGAILKSFTQAFCWMLVADWADLPEEGVHTCPLNRSQALEHASNDHFSVISHSLGSRITIDGMQRIATLLGSETEAGGKEEVAGSTLMNGIKHALKNQKVTLYMLSNQLPILQLGRKLPEVTGKQKIYCKPVGKHYASRIVSETSIIAFSDPNDILSYAIPYQFAEKYLDSRLCVDITNININVTPILDAFGLGEVANPLAAHTGYDDDERVVSLIANGIGHTEVAPLVKEKCEWTELIN